MKPSLTEQTGRILEAKSYGGDARVDTLAAKLRAKDEDRGCVRRHAISLASTNQARKNLATTKFEEEETGPGNDKRGDRGVERCCADEAPEAGQDQAMRVHLAGEEDHDTQERAPDGAR
jgi:hypothetical protein